MTTNVRALPPRVEQRLSDLVELKEFDLEEVRYCRQTYWDDREGWHGILISCYDHAQQRVRAARDAMAMTGAGG